MGWRTFRQRGGGFPLNRLGAKPSGICRSSIALESSISGVNLLEAAVHPWNKGTPMPNSSTIEEIETWRKSLHLDSNRAAANHVHDCHKNLNH